MSNWDDDELPMRLSLKEVQEALNEADRGAFLGLLVKALRTVDVNEGGVIASLREEIRDLQTELAYYKGRATSAEAARANALKTIEDRDGTISALRRVNDASDAERAGQLLNENDRLTKTVATQRLIIAQHEKRSGRVLASPLDWSLGKALAAFASPITGAVSVR